MSNKKREWYPNAIYHITIRGNRRNDIFRDREDFQVYLMLIEGTIRYYNLEYEILAYCLMDNHVHLLVGTKERHIKYFMMRMNSTYTRYFNNKYNYIGHLYQDRYFSEIIESDEQLLETSRYIHLNPVKAKMVVEPKEYEWSSYSTYMRNRKVDFLNVFKILGYFQEEIAIDLYRRYVERIDDFNEESVL